MTLYDNLLENLQSFVSDSRKKSLELRKLSEASIGYLHQFCNLPEAELILNLRRNETFLQPVFYACNKGIERYIPACLSIIQLLVMMDALPISSYKSVFQIFVAVCNINSDFQIKVLQILPLICSKNTNLVRGDTLKTAIRASFFLTKSKNATISNAAAATLRQIFTSVFDCVSAQQSFEDDEAYSNDALSIFKDICLLVDGQKPVFLSIDYLPQTFGLELLESILDNHKRIFEWFPFQDAIRVNLLPLITASLATMASFPIILRVARVLTILFRQQSALLIVDFEVILSFLNHILDSDETQWKKALFLEVFRVVFSNDSFLRDTYQTFDYAPGRKSVISDLITTFSRVINEKPSIMGVGSGVIYFQAPEEHSRYNDDQLSVSMDKITGSYTGKKGESHIGITRMTIPRVPCLEQLDKQEPPLIPDTYIPFLAMCCLVLINDRIHCSLQVVTNKFGYLEASKLIKETDNANAQIKSLSPGDVELIRVFKTLISANWTAFLASFSTFLSAALSFELLVLSVNSYTKFTVICSVLGLDTPRDALLTTLCNKALPSSLIANNVPHYSSSNSNISGRLSTSTVFSVEGLKEAATTIAGMASYDSSHEDKHRSFKIHEVIFLKTLATICRVCGTLLGSSWKLIFEACDKAEIIFGRMPSSKSLSTSSMSQAPTSTSRYYYESKDGAGVIEMEILAYRRELSSAITSTKEYASDAYMSFLETLLDSLTNSSVDTAVQPTPTRPQRGKNGPPGSGHQRNTSKSLITGIKFLRRSSETLYSFHILESVCNSNVERFFNEDDEKSGWTKISSTLSSIFKGPTVAAELKIQAAKTLAYVLVELSTRISTTKIALNVEFQRRFLASLYSLQPTELTKDSEASLTKTTDYEISWIGVEAMSSVLETNGQRINHGWHYIFETLSFTCLNAVNLFGTEKGARLIWLSFSCLQLICTDFLDSLSMKNYCYLLETLPQYCRQSIDVNVALTGVGLFWNVSDTLKNLFKGDDFAEIYSNREEIMGLASSESDVVLPEVLWLILLIRLADLCENSWSGVQHGAAQILFRIFSSHRLTLGVIAWASVNNLVILRLIDSPVFAALEEESDTAETESKAQTVALVLSGISEVYAKNMSVLRHSDNFISVWRKVMSFINKHHQNKLNTVYMSAYKSLKIIAVALSQLKVDEASDSFAQTVQIFYDTWKAMGSVSFYERENSTILQEALTLFVEALLNLITILPLSMADTKLIIHELKSALVYTKSPSYSLDVDFLSPLQQVSVRVVQALLETKRWDSFIISFMADLISEAFSEQKLSKSEHPTLICISKLFFNSLPSDAQNSIEELIEKRVLAKVLSSLLLPMRCKYRCPKASRINSEEKPLWISATRTFLDIVELIMQRRNLLDDEKSAELFELSVKGMLYCIHPDDSYSFEWSLSEVYEDFDLEMLQRLNSLWSPLLHASCLSKHIPTYMSTIVSGSMFYQYQETGSIQIKTMMNSELGSLLAMDLPPSTESLIPNRREQIAVCCLKVLHKLCYHEHGEIADLAKQTIEKRICCTLKKFIANQEIRGSMPFVNCQDLELRMLFDCVDNQWNLYSNVIRKLFRLAYVVSQRTRMQNEVTGRIGGMLVQDTFV
ncbi:guanyl-nucleotide exchange factor [Schizosaccharomyces japonicus yFS275]|uniref:Guanyl-nucleotide exchange factor n=1 Tax=Schizosaccharomyces japonicus (strain yFS275 / FY16936) TaxID=402676 RepID=B6JXA6_SCHJY|nr:guanyl-nucleotide exchange factor [Schizosaccharomyces japonicus yFS275]EEB06007.2 guanyl-nucleotide exchange factor [Schizosaccharomyces japonicus yFS275]